MRFILKRKPDALLDHDVAVQLFKAVLASESIEIVLDGEDRADVAAGRPMRFEIDYGEDGES